MLLFLEIVCAALVYHGARILPATEPCLINMGSCFGIQISDAPASRWFWQVTVSLIIIAKNSPAHG